MRYCDKCNITVDGPVSYCPLCQNILEGESDGTTYPKIEKPVFEHKIYVAIVAFVSVVVAAMCVALNIMLYTSHKRLWSVFVIAGILCFWISFAMALKKRQNIPKSIVWQVGIISLMAIAIDKFGGNIGWAIDYVVPILCICAMISMKFVTRIKQMRMEEYIVYLIIDCVFGLVPAVFIALGMVHTVIPSAICIAVSIIAMGAVAIFQYNLLKKELHRRMHM